jgi:hypothetical protein
VDASAGRSVIGRICQARASIAVRCLAALIAKHQYSAAYQLGQIHSTRGETELAFQWLERAYRQRDPGLAEMKCDPAFRSLHSDPRWQPFVRKVGLAD